MKRSLGLLSNIENKSEAVVVWCVLATVVEVLVVNTYAIVACAFRLLPFLKDGICAGGRLATCTCAREIAWESWSCGSPGCTSPAPLPQSTFLLLAASCRCWCPGNLRWASGVGCSCDTARTAAAAGDAERGLSWEACPTFARVSVGWPAHGWQYLVGSWPRSGSLSWRWTVRWRRFHSHLRLHLCDPCSSSCKVEMTSETGHLEKRREEFTQGLEGNMDYVYGLLVYSLLYNMPCIVHSSVLTNCIFRVYGFI